MAIRSDSVANPTEGGSSDSAEEVLIRIKENSPRTLPQGPTHSQLDRIEIKFSKEVLTFIDDDHVEIRRVIRLQCYLEGEFWEK